MHAVKQKTWPAAPALYEARVVDLTDDGQVRLDDGGIALVAASCLVRPENGDRVLAVALDGGMCFVLSVLTRAATVARLEVAGATAVTLTAPALTLAATEGLRMQSLHDVDITAAGNVCVAARNLVQTATASLVQHVKHCVMHAGTYALQVGTLFRMHGKQALITAERDVKIDAERINLG